MISTPKGSQNRTDASPTIALNVTLDPTRFLPIDPGEPPKKNSTLLRTEVVLSSNALKLRNYRPFRLLVSRTGFRPSAMQRLTVGQFRTVLNEEKPVLYVLAEQEKNMAEH